MKKIILLLTILFSTLLSSQTIHDDKVQMKDVDEMTTVETTSQVLSRELPNGEIKYIPLSTIYSNIIVPVQFASNGLSVFDNIVKLGGSLTENTVINTIDRTFGVFGNDNNNYLLMDGDTNTNTFFGTSQIFDGTDITIESTNTTVNGNFIVANNTPEIVFRDLLNIWDGILDVTPLTANRTYSLPDLSGTIALTSQIPGTNDYVPYTGATQNIDLNTRDLTTTGTINASNFIGNGSGVTNVDATTLNGTANYLLNRVLLSTNNIDNLISRAIYAMSNLTNGTFPVGYTPSKDDILTVLIAQNTFTIHQELVTVSNKVYRRSTVDNGSTWSSWVQIGFSDSFYEDVTTFSPTLVDNGGGATYSATTTNGTYYRVGNIVHFTASFVTISTTGTPTGQLRINNLPYNPSGSVENIEILNFRGSDVSSTDIGLMVGRVATGYAYFYNKTNASSADSVTFTSGVLTVSGSYSVNQYTP